jgi:hypothetical protein
MQKEVRNMAVINEDDATKIGANQESLEELSDSDLPVADIATALLELEAEA